MCSAVSCGIWHYDKNIKIQNRTSLLFAYNLECSVNPRTTSCKLKKKKGLLSYGKMASGKVFMIPDQNVRV